MGFPHLLAVFQGNQPVRRGRKVLSEDSAWAAVSFGCPASPPWVLLVRDRLGSKKAWDVASIVSKDLI